jgi:hypothetical protein
LFTTWLEACRKTLHAGHQPVRPGHFSGLARCLSGSFNSVSGLGHKSICPELHCPMLSDSDRHPCLMSSGECFSVEALDASSARETPMRSLFRPLAHRPWKNGVGSRESANPVGTVARIPFSPQSIGDDGGDVGLRMVIRSDQRSCVALNWRRRLLGKGHDAGIRRWDSILAGNTGDSVVV